jgi:hypothetical protein
MAELHRGPPADRLAVGLWGASQSGKTTLAAALVGAQPRVELGGTSHALAAVLPAPGRETGHLSLRLTTRPVGAGGTWPVSLRLLGEADLAVILGEAFQADFDPHWQPGRPFDDAAMQALCASLPETPDPVAGAPDEAAVQGIEAYFRRWWPVAAESFAALGYWGALRRLAPRLRAPDRARLFAPLWGGLDDLTAMFVRLQQARAALGDPDPACRIFAGAEALLPREDSLLDVEQLRSESSAPLRVAIADAQGLPGEVRSLARPLLAALVDELELPLQADPDSLLQTCDLVDFAGLRPVERLPGLPRDAAARRDAVLGLYTRAKVALAHARAAGRLDALLCCLPPGIPEGRRLAPQVDAWVRVRPGGADALLAVLTATDRERRPLPGSFASERLPMRVRFAVIDLFGSLDWFNGFRSCFLTALVPPRDATPAWDAGLREGLLEDAPCRRLFGDPAAAWAACVESGDGGIARVRRHLERVLAAAGSSLEATAAPR